MMTPAQIAAHPLTAAMAADREYLASHGIRNPRVIAPVDLDTFDDAVTAAGDALTAAERRRDALVALLAAMQTIDTASEDPLLSKDVARMAYGWIPAEGFEAIHAQIKAARDEVTRLEAVVHEAQKARAAFEAQS